MVTVNFKKIDLKRRINDISKAEVARRIDIEPPAYVKFVKSGRILKKHLELVVKICKVLKLDPHKIIKF